MFLMEATCRVYIAPEIHSLAVKLSVCLRHKSTPGCKERKILSNLFNSLKIYFITCRQQQSAKLQGGNPSSLLTAKSRMVRVLR